MDEEVEIIDFLVDNKAIISDFSRSRLIWFFVKENFHMVLFLAESKKTYFERYIVACFSENMNEMITLWDNFDQRIQAGKEVTIIKLAKKKVHDLIAMSETLRALIITRDFEVE